jgi:Zn-dependent peptidase ImmA (M78 family)
VTLSRIEKQRQEPEVETVNAMAHVLGYPASYFFLSDVDELKEDVVSFRSLSGMTSKERNAALSSGQVAIEVAEWLKTNFDLPVVDLPEINGEMRPEAAARYARQYWGIGERPIGHLVNFLEAKGVRVFSLSEDTKNVDAFSFWRGGVPYIFLNSFKTAERSRFDAAHELGHLIMHRHGGPVHREAEVEANQFSSSFLMPSADVFGTVPYVQSLAQLLPLKRRWGVSLSALVYRLHKLKIITDWQSRDFYIKINQLYGREEPNGLSRELSSIWLAVLKSLWTEGKSRAYISEILMLPSEEIDAILFSLTSDNSVPAKATVITTLKLV